MVEEASEKTGTGREEFCCCTSELSCAVLQGKLKEAEPLYRRALAIKSKVLGKKHTSTQNTAIGLWNILQAKGGCEAEMAELDAEYGI